MNLIKKLIRLSQPPSLALNTAARKNYRKFSELVRLNNSTPLVLCLGSGEKSGAGMAGLAGVIKDKMVCLDIAAVPDIDVNGDGQYLPFKGEIFDGVIIQAVLEHVQKPFRIIRESARILKTGGYIYVETPFLQAEHGATDYQRYTLDGLKNLLKDFRLVQSGVCVGPTAALINNAHSYFSLLFSLNMEILWKFWRVIFGWFFFPFKYLDLLAAGIDKASLSAGAFYYLGRKQ
ncbi:MAG: methyltransferase domain-containing protein [Planctomycetota bacterium]